MITELSSKKIHAQLFDYTYQTFNTTTFNAMQAKVIGTTLGIYTPLIYDALIERKSTYERFTITQN